MRELRNHQVTPPIACKLTTVIDARTNRQLKLIRNWLGLGSSHTHTAENPYRLQFGVAFPVANRVVLVRVCLQALSLGSRAAFWTVVAEWRNSAHQQSEET